MSPVERCLKDLKKLGYPYWRVENFNSFTQRKTDLFGLFDYLCIVKDKYLVGLQITTKDHISDHRKKLYSNPLLNDWLSTGAKGYLWAVEKGKRGAIIEELTQKVL